MQKIDLNGKTILVTGAAGFIGSYLMERLKNDLKGATVIGIDNMNDYLLSQDFDFVAHKQLVSMQPGDVPTTYAVSV